MADSTGKGIVITSPGGGGFLPWVDREHGIVGVIAVKDRLERTGPTSGAVIRLVRAAAKGSTVSSPPQMNRRLFLVTTGTAAGSLVLGVAPPRARDKAEPLGSGPFVRIDPDGSVTVTCARAEMGQGAPHRDRHARGGRARRRLEPGPRGAG